MGHAGEGESGSSGTAAGAQASPEATGRDVSCSMTAVLLTRVVEACGEEAVERLLALAGSRRSPEYLRDTGNWIAHDEAIALWRAGAEVTHHPQFSRAVGEDTVRRLAGSPVAALLRSLGSPEKVYGQLATGSGRFSTVATLEAVALEPGRAEIVATPVEGFPRSVEHCAWTWGLLSNPPNLFGLPSATVEHEECAAYGADSCRYVVRWSPEGAATGAASSQVLALRAQLTAMRDRLHGMFATAADLIGGDDVETVLPRIADRAAVEVRAPRYLLTVRLPGARTEQHYSKGLEGTQAAEIAERIAAAGAGSELPESWLVVPVRSERHDYGHLAALFNPGQTFFPQERDLLEVYARYAASALDSASALAHAKRMHGQSRALLELSRALAASGTSVEVAGRLADAVPVVVDCDEVNVYLYEEELGALVHAAFSTRDPDSHRPPDDDWSCRPEDCPPLARLLDRPSCEPMLIDANTGDDLLRRFFARTGAVATIVVPLCHEDVLLGLLTVSVSDDGARLRPDENLVDRLSGVAAQAASALQNGRLVDAITHQALHDALTGLPNRVRFGRELREALGGAMDAGEVSLIYIDLDGFKPVNDEFGHDVGDALLVVVGERIRSCTRSGDVVARLGGDEFTVLIDDRRGTEGRDALIRRLHRAFREPFQVMGHELRVGASIGSAVFPADADSPEALLQVADRAMFAVKRSR